jgi:hypothetical protein
MPPKLTATRVGLTIQLKPVQLKRIDVSEATLATSSSGNCACQTSLLGVRAALPRTGQEVADFNCWRLVPTLVVKQA